MKSFRVLTGRLPCLHMHDCCVRERRGTSSVSLSFSSSLLFLSLCLFLYKLTPHCSLCPSLSFHKLPPSCRIQIACSTSFSVLTQLPSKGALFQKVLCRKTEASTSPSLFLSYMFYSTCLLSQKIGILLYIETPLQA